MIKVSKQCDKCKKRVVFTVKFKRPIHQKTESRWVIYHKARDLQKMGYKLSGRKKDVKGITYLEVEGLFV